MKEAQAEASRVAILDALEARFGLAAPEVAARLKTVADLATLRGILRLAVTEPTFDSFLLKLPSGS